MRDCSTVGVPITAPLVPILCPHTEQGLMRNGIAHINVLSRCEAYIL